MSALLDVSLPRFPAKTVNSEVMKQAQEPEQGGGLVTREGREAPSRGAGKWETRAGSSRRRFCCSGRNTSQRGPEAA